ncbi:endonuclease III [PVC group bacterium]|nr:endonuclease III [PVC group bacterium]
MERRCSPASFQELEVIMTKKKAREIYKSLLQRYPQATCQLKHTSPFELLIATILSAQATDVSVNKASPELFKTFPTPKAFADTTPEEIEPFISSIGLFRSKAKSVFEASKRIEEVYGGKVPDTMNELVTLRGVARKTANVVLGNAMGKNEGVVVDTHVSRLSLRFGLSQETKPIKIEQDLMSLFPQENWTTLSHLLIRHGRDVCKKRGGTCKTDPICKRYCSNAKS